MGAKTKASTPATPLRMELWMRLEKDMKSKNMAIRALALAWVLLINGTLRFAHLQRSKHVANKTAYIEFLATSGKAKFQGARVPMKWCIPKMTITGINVAKTLKKFMNDRGDALGQSDFWLPDFGPARAKLAEVDRFEGSAMTINKFSKLSMDLFMSYGAQPSELADISTYSARRI